MDQEYYQLIDDYHHKTISNEGLLSLMDWVAECDQNQQTFREVLQAFEAAEARLAKPKNQDQSWNLIQQHLNQTPVPSTTKIIQFKWKKWYAIAAMLCMICAMALTFYSQQKPAQHVNLAFNEIYNPKGQKRLVTLPDGSNIYLNGDTRIWYTRNFNTGKRIVMLDGEAFFDVQHKPKQPFIVKTGSISTTVLGTSFNINAHKNASEFAVTVQTGKVGVVIKHPDQSQAVHFLLPDDELRIDRLTLKSAQTTVDSRDASGWREYKLAFYNKTLLEITESIGREYDVDFEIPDPYLRKMKLTAKFDKCTVKQIMDILAELSDTRYRIHENKIEIRNKN